MYLFFSLDLVTMALLNVLFMKGALFALIYFVFMGACLFKMHIKVFSKVS